MEILVVIGSLVLLVWIAHRIDVAISAAKFRRRCRRMSRGRSRENRRPKC